MRPNPFPKGIQHRVIGAGHVRLFMPQVQCRDLAGGVQHGRGWRRSNGGSSSAGQRQGGGCRGEQPAAGCGMGVLSHGQRSP